MGFVLLRHQNTLQAYMIRALSVLVACTAVWLIGSAAPQAIALSPIGNALPGKSTQEIMACAGHPVKETKTVEEQA